MDNYYFLEMEITRRQADLIHEAKLARMLHEAQERKLAEEKTGARKTAAGQGSRSPVRRAARWVPLMISRLFTL